MCRHAQIAWACRSSLRSHLAPANVGGRDSCLPAPVVQRQLPTNVVPIAGKRSDIISTLEAAGRPMTVRSVGPGYAGDPVKRPGAGVRQAIW